MVPRYDLILYKMDSKEVILLKKALDRQKKARRQAECILEEKSRELYSVTQHLKQTNSRLENLLSDKSSGLDGAFINIIDPYLVIDLEFNVINMNNSAKDLLGYDHIKEKINVERLIHPEYREYTTKAFKFLMRVGILKNYQAKFILKDGTERFVQMNCSLIYDPSGKPIATQGIIRDISEETEIKQLLAEQKKQLDIIVENSPLGIVLTNQSSIIKVNPTFSALLGYSEHELKQLTVEEISENGYGRKSIELLSKMNSGALDNFQTVKRYVKKDGGTILAKTYVSAVRNNNDQAQLQVAIIEDITKQQEAEEKLKASENRLALLVSNLQTGVLLEDENRKIALTNQKFCDLFEISTSPETLKGADCSNSAEGSKDFFIKPEEFVTRIEEILKERKPVLSDELVKIDGQILERDYIPIYNLDKYKGHLWTYQDVTIRKNYKKNLEVEREKYSSIIANMNLGIAEVDNNGIIQMVNQSFCLMCGYSEEELLSQKRQ